MALIGQTLPSLLDVYSRTDKNGRIAKSSSNWRKATMSLPMRFTCRVTTVPTQNHHPCRYPRAGVAPLQPGRAAYQNPDRSGD